MKLKVSILTYYFYLFSPVYVIKTEEYFLAIYIHQLNNNIFLL